MFKVPGDKAMVSCILNFHVIKILINLVLGIEVIRKCHYGVVIFTTTNFYYTWPPFRFCLVSNNAFVVLKVYDGKTLVFSYPEIRPKQPNYSISSS